MTDAASMRELVRKVHMAQWTPDRTCRLGLEGWRSLDDSQRVYLRRLARMSNIKLEADGVDVSGA